MFPKRKVNALTPIYASLDREDEDLSLPPKIPLRHVHNTTLVLETCSLYYANLKKLPIFLLKLIKHYRNKKTKKAEVKFASKQNEKIEINENDLTNDEILSQGSSFAPFASNDDDLPKELENLLVPLTYEEFVYGDILQHIADTYHIVIGLKQPMPVAQLLIKNDYDVANFKHQLNFSQVGPTAGFLTFDADFCEANPYEKKEHQKQVNTLLQSFARLQELKLSKELVENAISFSNLKRVDTNIYVAMYFGKLVYFTIAAPDYWVRYFDSGEKVLVLAKNNDASAVIENYRLTLIAAKKNTPTQILAQKGKLADIVLSMLNKEVHKDTKKKNKFFTLDANVCEAGQWKREFFFFPKSQPKMLINRTNRHIFCQIISKCGFIV